MTVTRDTTQEIGWAYEWSAVGTQDAETERIVDANSLYWKFGLDAQKYSMPVQSLNWQELYKGGSRDPDDLILIESIVMGSLGFYPVNGLPFYLFLGEATSTAGTHTVTGINSGETDPITIRWESYGGAAGTEKYISSLGCRIATLNVALDSVPSAGLLSCGLGYIGIKTQTSSYTSHLATKYPTDDYLMSGNEQYSRYRRDSNFQFIWDQGADNVDYSEALINFQYSGTNNLLPEFLNGQSELEYITPTYRTHSFAFDVVSGTDKSIWDDYIAKTKHNIRFKIFNSATNYLQLDLNTCGITIEKNYAYYNKNEVPIYSVRGKAKSLTVTVKDGLSINFYGLT